MLLLASHPPPVDRSAKRLCLSAFVSLLAFRPRPWSAGRRAEGRGLFGKGILHLREKSEQRGGHDGPREASASDSGKIPEAWIGQEVMIETTEVLSSDLRASAPVYLEDVNERGVVMLVTRHRDQSQSSRYFYPWSVVGWIRLAEEDEREEEPRAADSS